MLLVKQYGLRRTGTNFLQWLLEANYKVQFERSYVGRDEIDRKHGYCKTKQVSDEYLPTIVCTRHPLSWLYQVYRYYNIWELTRITFEQFMLRADAHIVPLNCHGRDLLERWNWAHEHWLNIDIKPVPKFICQYEALVQRPELLCENIMERFNGLHLRTTDIFKLPDQHCGPLSRMRGTAVLSDYDRQWEPQKKFMQLYTPRVLELVKHEISEDLMKRLRYDWKGYICQ